MRNILGEDGEEGDLLCSGPCLAMELVMEDAVNKFAQLANDKVAMQCSFSQGSCLFIAKFIHYQEGKCLHLFPYKNCQCCVGSE